MSSDRLERFDRWPPTKIQWKNLWITEDFQWKLNNLSNSFYESISDRIVRFQSLHLIAIWWALSFSLLSNSQDTESQRVRRREREREKKIPKPLVVASRRILSSQSLVEVSLPKIQSFCNYKITELSNRNARYARKLVKWILKSDRKASTFWRLAKNENNENWSSNFTNFKRRSAIFLERDLLLETRAAPQRHFVVNLSPYESLSATV